MIVHIVLTDLSALLISATVPLSRQSSAEQASPVYSSSTDILQSGERRKHRHRRRGCFHPNPHLLTIPKYSYLIQNNRAVSLSPTLQLVHRLPSETLSTWPPVRPPRWGTVSLYSHSANGRKTPKELLCEMSRFMMYNISDTDHHDLGDL